MALTQVKTTGLADDAVTSAKIADDAVVTAAIADDAVTGANIADDTVAEANMANDAISLAELKAGTDGQIITYDASGNPTAVGPGTDGQVLTSTGAGSPPAFEDVPAGGATINNATANELVTVASTTTQLDAEANLTFDGSNLDVAGKVHITDDLAGGQLVVGTSTSDTATKYGTFNVPHKTNSEEPVMVIGGESTASDSQNVYIGGGFSTQNACKQILFYTAADTTTVTGTERVKITTTGNVNIADGNLAFSTAGKGIDFSATSGAGSGELFDDYEEGTWTPDLYHQGSNNNSGYYTKIGRMVYATFRLTALSAAGNNNHQSIASLPFTVKNVSANGGCAKSYQTYNLIYDGSPNSTQFYLQTLTGGNVNAVDIGTKTLSGTLIYMTDS